MFSVENIRNLDVKAGKDGTNLKGKGGSRGTRAGRKTKDGRQGRQDFVDTSHTERILASKYEAKDLSRAKGTGVLQTVNFDQRANGRVNNRNRNHRSAPYNPNAARIRTRNYNNLSQLLMSMAKQGAYVPAHYEQNENDEKPQQF